MPLYPFVDDGPAHPAVIGGECSMFILWQHYKMRQCIFEKHSIVQHTTGCNVFIVYLHTETIYVLD